MPWYWASEPDRQWVLRHSHVRPRFFMSGRCLMISSSSQKFSPFGNMFIRPSHFSQALSRSSIFNMFSEQKTTEETMLCGLCSRMIRRCQQNVLRTVIFRICSRMDDICHSARYLRRFLEQSRRHLLEVLAPQAHGFTTILTLLVLVGLGIPMLPPIKQPQYPFEHYLYVENDHTLQLSAQIHISIPQRLGRNICPCRLISYNVLGGIPGLLFQHWS